MRTRSPPAGRAGDWSAVRTGPDRSLLDLKSDPAGWSKDGKMVLRKSFYGQFLGCDKYPTCKTMMKIVDGKVDTTPVTPVAKKTSRKKAVKKKKKAAKKKTKKKVAKK